MPTEIKMPALSPTMEEGKLARWLVKEGDEVASGDIIAEIETDKATMEFEAVDEGVIASIAVAEGTEKVKVGTVIATITVEGEDAAEAERAPAQAGTSAEPIPARAESVEAPSSPLSSAHVANEKSSPLTSSGQSDSRIVASPLARRLAAEKGVDLESVNGSGPHGRIIKADVDGATPGTAKPAAAPRQAANTSAPPTEAVKAATVLVGAHYQPSVRRILKLIEADTDRNLKQLLGEAINDLAVKYGKPQPYGGEA